MTRLSWNIHFFVKPLITVGTKQSHKIGVLLGRCVPGNGPYLLQEYGHHDEILFKVYVLEKKVWVFQRTSLPNLPLGEVDVSASASSSFADCKNYCGNEVDIENGSEIGQKSETTMSQRGSIECDSQRRD